MSSSGPPPTISLRERLYEDISSGVFRPGEWLRQIDLETRYGAPRFSVRQALSELAVSELLEHVPNRGFRVAEPSMEKRAEMTQVRLCLEIPACIAAIDHADEADIAQIAAAAEAYGAGIENLPYAEVRQLNHAFHRRLLQSCGNETMASLTNSLRERSLPGAWSRFVSPARMRQSNKDHHRMVDALRRRDRETMADAVRDHLTAWQRDI